MNTLTPPDEKSIWAFDIGKGSLGDVVRDGLLFSHAESWLIPEDFARRGPATAAGTPASRYRAWRTREAHLAREERLREVLTDAGIEVLQPKRVRRVGKKWEVAHPGDEKLTREFPEKGDNTCYTSCLLRIKLLRGEKLQGWQIHKALHSAIQRRGYDDGLPWKRKATRNREGDEKEEGETKRRVSNYKAQLEAMAPGQNPFHFPCYFDAWRLGLWNPQKPSEISLRVDHMAKPARNRDGSDISPMVVPRELVIEEVHSLIEAAAKQFPKLAEQAGYILHGPGGQAYASYYPQLRKQYGLREGGANDWLGILGQKVPRFDNRIIAKCALIPRFNVCKAEIRYDVSGKPYPDSLLVSEVTFLLKLKNMQVTPDDKAIRKLTAEEIRIIFNDPNRETEKFSFTEAQWKKKCVEFGVQPAAGHEKVDSPKTGGRSRFCRPALRILRELILSGDAPQTVHACELEKIPGNTNPQKGLVERDLGFLKRMGDTWENLYVPDQQFDALLRLREESGRDAAIRGLIGSINDPIVRHRLETFWKRLAVLEEKFGAPAEVVLEFVREDFLGKDAKIKLQKFQNDREKARKEAREQAAKAGAASRSAALKYELLKQQGGICLYTGEGLGVTSLDDLEIEHIVPRSQGGPDALVNYVVTKRATNEIKGNRTPHQWLASNGTAAWDAYVNRVEKCQKELRRKKVLLLTSPEAPELVSRYTALAETAWIAKLSQALVALYFGWPINSQTGERRITIISGGVTARVRRQYQINSILHGPCPEGTDPREWEEECDKKNRDDKRHHALDAMVLSFLPAWTRDKNRAGFFRLPDGVTRETFAKAISKVMARNLAFEKPPLDATIFGQRIIEGKIYGTSRKTLVSIGVKETLGGKRSIRPSDKIDTRVIVDRAIRRDVDAFLQAHPNLDLETWDAWCATYRRGDKGPYVKKVTLTITKPDVLDEYRDLSKDGTGQLRRGKNHKGYFIVDVPAPAKSDPGKRKYEVRPVYAHTSQNEVFTALKKHEGANVVGYFESGCLIRIDAAIDHPKTPLLSGLYRLNSIWEDRRAVVTSSDWKTSSPISLDKFIAAGFRRADKQEETL